MDVSITPTTRTRYSIPETGGIYLYLHERDGGQTQVCFHPKYDNDALDRLDSLIETAVALRDGYRRKVEAEAAEMSAEEEAVRLDDETHDHRTLTSPDSVAA